MSSNRRNLLYDKSASFSCNGRLFYSWRCLYVRVAVFYNIMSMQVRLKNGTIDSDDTILSSSLSAELARRTRQRQHQRLDDLWVWSTSEEELFIRMTTSVLIRKSTCTGRSKKVSRKHLSTSSPNVDRFSNFFAGVICVKICDKLGY